MVRTTVLGKGALAIRVAEWFIASPDHVLDRVVPVIPEPAWTDSLLSWSRERGVDTVESGDYEDIPHEAPLHLVFSVFYDKIFGPEFIDRCELALNLHNAPLPKYRGISPINWALKNGELAHGVTIHEVSSEIDGGPIVAQLTYSIYPEFDEVIDVYERALAYGWTLFEQTMPIMSHITARPQNPRGATYYSKADDDRLGERRSFTRSESRA